MLQTHVQTGFEIIKGIKFPWQIAQIVLQHHERLDGSGYPQGLKGEAILPEAKILGVADAIEAMLSHRPYRPALGLDAALAEIEAAKGRLYDPAAVEACIDLFRNKGFNFQLPQPQREAATMSLKAFVSASLVFALSAGVVHAADLPNPPAAPPSPAAEAAPRWYVKLGALGALNQSSVQPVRATCDGGRHPGNWIGSRGRFRTPAVVGRAWRDLFEHLFRELPGRLFLYPQLVIRGIERSSPLADHRDFTGSSATPPFSEAVLGKLLPGVVPITAVYHFTQFGAIQPYLGSGIVPSFELAVQDGFNTGGSFAPTVGLVAQAGSDYSSTGIGASF